MKYILSVLLTIAFLPAIASSWPEDQQVKSTVIDYNESSHMLTNSQKSSIKKFVSQLEKRGKNTTLGIATWSDQPFPGAKEDLSSNQRKLANKRITSIKNYLDEIRYAGNVDTFNMAEKTNWLARLFNTESNELKSVFAKRDTNTSILKEKYRVYKNKGGAQKSVLVVSPPE